MKKFFSLVLALVMALSLTTVAWGATPKTVYVDETNGLDTNDGLTTATAVATLDKALHLAAAGDTVMLAAGNYELDVNDAFTNSVADEDITIVGPSDAVLTKILVSDDLTDITFEGVTIKSFDIQAGINVKNLAFIGCVFDKEGSTTGAHIQFHNAGFPAADGLKVENCSFIGGKYGILIQNSSGTKNVEIKNNTFTDIVANAVQFGTSSATDSIEITGNTVNSAGDRAIRISAAAGADLNISNNTIVDGADDDNEAIKISGTGYTASVKANTLPTNSKVVLDNIVDDAIEVTVDASGKITAGTFYSEPANIADGYQYLANGTVVPVTAASVPVPTLYVWDNAAEDWATYYIATGAEMDDLKQDASDKCLPCYLIDGEYFVEVPESAATYKLVYGNAKVFLTSVPAKVVKYDDTASVLTVVDEDDAECGDYYVTNLDEDDVYYISYDKKGVVDGIWVAEKNGSKQILVNGKIVDAEVASVPFMFHDFKGYDVVNYQYTTVKCAECGKVAKLYANATAATVGKLTPFKIDNLGWVTFADYMDFGANAPVVTDKVQSAETFDAGIALYVGMSVMAASGSAVVIGKKKD